MNIATSRRRFLASSAAAGSLLLTTPRAPASMRSANDRVRIAVLGLNGRGKAHLSGFMGLDNVEIAAVVDPDSEVLGRTLKMLGKKAGKATAAPAALADFRRVLDDKSIDAVSIAAPNHWHSLISALGAAARSERMKRPPFMPEHPIPIRSPGRRSWPDRARTSARRPPRGRSPDRRRRSR